MMRLARVLLVLSVFTVTLRADGPPWGRFFENLRIDEQMQRLSSAAKPIDAAFVGAEVVPMTAGTEVLHDQTVIVRGGRIWAIGPRATTPIPNGVTQIDARRKFLFPGLTDTHVHTLQTNGDLLLDLLHGVTTVREMDGFPWLLRIRDAARANRILAPTSYVASQILNGAPMGWYATVIKTPEQARRTVLDMKAAGYDYIKVHNVMPVPLYDAIASAAREVHLPLVGHIPHEITVAHAIESGQFTVEHFKGFLLDTTLEMSTENWLEQVRGANVWIAPTLTNRRGGMSPAETEEFLHGPDAQLVSMRARSTWVDEVREEGEAQRKVWALSQTILSQLLPVTRRFIAGTDSGGGYPNSIRGFALHDELETMESLGMPTIDALRATTVNAAIALGDPDSFGSIELGKRADLLLLDRNPLATVKNLRSPTGVMVRGIWLDADRLASIRRSITDIYATTGADKTLDNPSTAQLASLVGGLEALSKTGWIFNEKRIEQLADALRQTGHEALADRVASLISK